MRLRAIDDEHRRGPGFPMRRVVVVAKRLEDRDLRVVRAVRQHVHALAIDGVAVNREGKELIILYDRIVEIKIINENKYL